MKTKLILVWLVLLCNSLIYAQTNIYVATNGDDSNSGTINSPLKTLKAARDKVREAGASSGATVFFREGRYPLTETVDFDVQDGGSAGNPVTYTSYNNEKVIFDGSLFVDNSAFEATTSSQSSVLHSSAVGEVLFQTISDPQLIEVLKETTAQMSMDDKMLTMARFPNIGFGHINDASISGSEELNTEGTPSNPVGKSFKLVESISADKWGAEVSRTNKVIARGYLSADWKKELIRIHSVSSNGTIRFMDGTSYGLKDRSGPNRFFASHLLCELDEPGEWYFDESDNILYIWPHTPITPESKIGVWAGPQLAEIENAEYIEFKNFTVQCIGKGSNGDGAINFRSGNNYLVAGITFRYIAEPITACNFWRDVTNSSMLSCDFFDIWNNTRLYGGSFTSTGTIIRGNNSIENCHFTQIYSKGFYGKACGMSGVGNTFKNNLVHNMNGQPVTHNGIDHLITLNESFNVGIEEGDGGAFYTGNDLISYGNVIKHNFVHHIMSVPKLLGRASFFSDDRDGGEDILENVVYKGGWEAIKMNGGAGHTVQHNVVLDCYTGIRQGNPGSSGYNSSMEYINSTNGKSPTSSDKKNYMGRMLQKVGIPGWENGINESNWEERIEQFWRDRYTRFHWSMRSYANNNQMNAYECRFYDNMFWSNNTNVHDGGSVATESRSQSINLTVFENPDNLNFKFKSPRPSYAPDIPFENIGLYLDEYRCAVPNKNDYRRAIKQRFEHLACHTGDGYNPSTINDRLYFNSGKVVLSTLPCGETFEQTEFKFDLGTTTSSVFSGYDRLSNKTVPGSYGWTNTSGLNAVDRGTSSGANGLNRDLIYSSQAKTFIAKVPNGTYNVLITFGDASSAHDNIVVKAEGETKLSNINTTTGNSFFNKSFEVAVSDGELTLEFSDGGGSDPNWVATRLVITQISELTTVPVSGVTVSPSTLALNVGQTGDLTETISPSNATNKGVSWSSNNTSVATVNSSGLVTAVSAGNATITVNTIDQNKTATCAVTVTSIPVAGTDGWFDMGTSTSPVYTDYNRVTEQTTSGNYGWTNTSNLDSRDRGVGNDLNTDFVFSDQARTFEYTTANGIYDVVVTLGDSYEHDDMVIKAEGTVVKSNIDRAANEWLNESFQVMVNDGKLSLEFSDVGGSNPHWVVNRIKIDPATVTPPVDQTPYNGTAQVIPGTIEAEHYDVGGEGVAYHDANSGNTGGQVRTDDVDIEARDGGYNVGWAADGEWLEYTVNATAGTYDMQARVATQSSNKQVRVLLDGTELGVFDVPNTGNWGTFQTISLSNVVVSGGTNSILRIEYIGGSVNLNWIAFENNQPVNVALNKTTSQSSNNYTSDRGWAHEAADGNSDGVFNNNSVTHTQNDAQAWWQVDLGGVYNITDISVYNRDDCCQNRLSDFHVFVSDNAFTSTNLNTTINQSGVGNYYTSGTGADVTTQSVNRSGRYIRVQLSGTSFLSLAEVEVLSTGLKAAMNAQDNTITKLEVYPNPAGELLNFRLTGTTGNKAQIFVYTSAGELVIASDLGELDNQLNISGLSTGLYILKVIDSNQLFISRFIKK